MKSPESVQFRPDSLNLINLVFKYWKVLLITSVAAFIISVAFTLSITPLFRSAVILYPTTNVIESQTLFGTQNRSTELFGDEGATEKVLQILRSDRINNYLVKKYSLMKHYGIGENIRHKYTLLNDKLKKRITSRKTQFNSIEISVLDTDPVLASDMANDIASQIDTVFNNIVRDAGKKSYAAISNSYSEQLKDIKSIEDSLRVLNSVESASSYRGNLKAGLTNSSWVTASRQYSTEFLRLINLFESENENLSDIRSRLMEAKMSAEQDLPYTHIINRAFISEKKAFPRRTLIVVVSTFSTLLIILFILGLSDSLVRNEQ